MHAALPGRLFWRDIGWLMLLVSALGTLGTSRYSPLITALAAVVLIALCRSGTPRHTRRSAFLMVAACFGGMILGFAVGAVGSVATAMLLSLVNVREAEFAQFFLSWMTRGGVFVGLIDAWRQTTPQMKP